jgi:hypothetical protein
MSRSPKLFVAVLALVVALALALGASGSATAGALTKGAVKKIAAKVVKKKAGSLSVSHAATADTATTSTNASALAGKPPSAYTDDTIRYSLVSNTLSTSKSFALVGLAPGATYYVHFHLIMGSSPGSPAGNCQITVPGSDQLAWGYGTVFANAVSWDDGAVVTVPSAGNITIDCSIGATVKTFSTTPSFAEATPLDSVTSRAATVTPAGLAAPGSATPGSLATSGSAPRP